MWVMNFPAGLIDEGETPETAAETKTLTEGTEATSEENVSAETIPAEPRETTEQEETPKADTEIPEKVPEKEE